MASIPVSLAPTGAGNPVAAEAPAAATGGAGSDDQAPGRVFSLLIKQAVPQERKAKAEDLLLAMTAAPPVPPPPAPVDSLPLAGTMLPPALPQPLDAAPVQPAQEGPVQDALGRGRTQAVLPGLAGTKSIKLNGDKALSDAAAAAAAHDDDRSLSRFSADLTAQLMTPAAGMPMHDAHASAGILLKDVSALLGDPSDAIAGPRPTDAAAANQGAGALLQAADKAPPALPAANPAISVPLRHPEWADELGNRINWMVRQDVQSASIKLNPPHLGPLEVKVSMVNDQINVSFTTHHAPVREALDASLPRLRDMLGDSGLQLGDASVTHRSHSDQQQSGQQPGGYAGGGADHAGSAAGDDHVLTAVHEPLYYAGDGAVDLYA